MPFGNRGRRIAYTLVSPIYDRLAGLFASRRRRSIELLKLQPGERVLLVGAGSGLDLDFLPQGLQITAVDLTPAMLRRLRRRAKRLGLPVNALIMDGQRLTLADAAFDAVILHLILSVIPDPVACLREAARVLRPGGRAVILDKFVPDGRRVPLALRLANPVTSLLGSEITRQLGPILEGSTLRLVHREPAGLHAFMGIAVLEKPGQLQDGYTPQGRERV